MPVPGVTGTRSLADVNAKVRLNPLAARVHLRCRAGRWESYRRAFPPREGERILEVGVSALDAPGENHLLESYPFPTQITAVGLNDQAELRARHPEVRFLNADGRDLPFGDRAFDVVHSNAVVEHVGPEPEQRRFVAELMRVAHRGMISTPSRWFPIDSHTNLPLLHWLPRGLHVGRPAPAGPRGRRPRVADLGSWTPGAWGPWPYQGRDPRCGRNGSQASPRWSRCCSPGRMPARARPCAASELAGRRSGASSLRPVDSHRGVQPPGESDRRIERVACLLTASASCRAPARQPTLGDPGILRTGPTNPGGEDVQRAETGDRRIRRRGPNARGQVGGRILRPPGRAQSAEGARSLDVGLAGRLLVDVVGHARHYRGDGPAGEDRRDDRARRRRCGRWSEPGGGLLARIHGRSAGRDPGSVRWLQLGTPRGGAEPCLLCVGGPGCRGGRRGTDRLAPGRRRPRVRRRAVAQVTGARRHPPRHRGAARRGAQPAAPPGR